MRLFTDSIEIYEASEQELAARIGHRRLEDFRRTLQEIAGSQAGSPF